MESFLHKPRTTSFWVARYRGRSDVYEQQVDWSQVPRKGMTELILVSPDGQCGVLGHLSGDISDRAFQFKIALAEVGLGGSGRNHTVAQIIGVVTDSNAGCLCYAYDYEQNRLVGPFEDNLMHFQYGGGNALTHPSLDVLGVKLD